jgi:UPF0716 protein FxsA
VGPLLVVLFLLVPVVEIYVIIQVGQLIGPFPTLALLVIEALIGAWLLKREGRAAWISLQQAAASGRVPAQELVDAGLVLVGGTLLMAPGFVTDVVGFFFILPPTRPLARRLLVWFLVRRATRLIARAEWEARQPGGRRPQGRQAGRPSGRSSGRSGRPLIVEGELVEDSNPDPGAGGKRPAPGAKAKDRNWDPDDKGPGRVAGG